MRIPDFNTGRIAGPMKELTLGQCIELSGMNQSQHEHLTTAFLNHVTGADSRAWTVEERAFLVGHYLASTGDDGPDFPVGEYRFSDYLALKGSYGTEAVDGIRPIFGSDAEMIERNEGAVMQGRMHWLSGCLAVQANPASDDEFLAIQRGFLDGEISEFEQALADYLSARSKLQHLMNVTIINDGFAINGERDGEPIPVARFPAAAAIPRFFEALL